MVALVTAVLVLVWARLSRTPWEQLGFVRPDSWPRTIAIGIVFGASLKIVMKSLVMPLFGADPANQTFSYLVGNTAALPGILWTVVFGAGFGEEVVFRSFLFERLGKLLGAGLAATVSIIALTSAVFAAAHYPLQGVTGVQQAAIVGLIFGTIYAATRRIWMLIVAHAAFDVTAVAIIYYDVEAWVANLILTH